MCMRAAQAAGCSHTLLARNVKVEFEPCFPASLVPPDLPLRASPALASNDPSALSCTLAQDYVPGRSPQAWAFGEDRFLPSCAEFEERSTIESVGKLSSTTQTLIVAACSAGSILPTLREDIWQQVVLAPELARMQLRESMLKCSGGQHCPRTIEAVARLYSSCTCSQPVNRLCSTRKEAAKHARA
ncbi:hypothetical protein IE81DRAFT_185731 [Ceraceosorus guamensis]|uniref:Uncharacterized protein n=1 Tax=Ceraceosorus guamensis TaxID=1522189 RepID=A0A316VU41_9BASI|nr:hypothetical protein IE81DRAFT_185731 [Ceraceosorus guamensis]PWN41136.1 hypothetical protein IE81DRAFT_185731 [Ceraceosorus guamensis]